MNSGERRVRAVARKKRQPDTYAAFISYASSDREQAEELTRHLEGAGRSGRR